MRHVDALMIENVCIYFNNIIVFCFSLFSDIFYRLFVTPQVLLVTSSRAPDQWIFPGGGVEPEEDARVTAIREVEEEAGVLGRLDGRLGIFEVRVSIAPFIFSSFYKE